MSDELDNAVSAVEEALHLVEDLPRSGHTIARVSLQLVAIGQLEGALSLLRASVSQP